MTNEEILLSCFNETLLKTFPGIRGKTKKLYSNMEKEYEKKKNERDEKEIPEYLRTDKKMTKFLIPQFAKIQDIKDIGCPEKEGEQIRFITTTQLNVMSFLLYMMDQKGDIDELFISTFSIANKVIDVIDVLIQKKKIKKLTIIISNIKRSEKISDTLKALVIKHGCKISCKLAWIHTKIICFRIGKEYYTIEGSGNLTNNGRIEQYLFEKSKDSYAFHSEWITNVENYSEKMDVIKL